MGDCPLCTQKFAQDKLEAHVNMCLFLRESGESSKSPANGTKRKTFSIFGQQKRPKQELNNNRAIAQSSSEIVIQSDSEEELQSDSKERNPAKNNPPKKDQQQQKPMMPTDIPLAERMRPDTLDNYIGQAHIMNKNAVLRQVIDKHEIPSMILWGPPGCGKVGGSRLCCPYHST